MTERVPFGADYDVEKAEKQQRVGLKIQNKQPPLPTPSEQQENLHRSAQQVVNDDLALVQQTQLLVNKFLKTLNEKMLSVNKSPIAKSVEKTNVMELVNLALSINQDENKPEGYGSIALCNLLLKSMLNQRDRINELEFKLEKVSKELSRLSAMETNKGD